LPALSLFHCLFIVVVVVAYAPALLEMRFFVVFSLMWRLNKSDQEEEGKIYIE
jgi:hypothetical protein